MDTNTVLRIVDSVQSTLHPWMTVEGALVRFLDASPDLTYYDVSTLDGSHTSGGWLSNRFDLVEPQPITGPLPAGTLLHCVNNGAQERRLTDGAFYRLAHVEGNGQFVNVFTLDGRRIVLDDESDLLYEFMSSRFVYYPDSAPAEPTTEKGTTMSITTSPITREIAATLPVGAVLINTNDSRRTFTLDRAGIDSDGDFHGTYEDRDYGIFQNWSYFHLPANDTLLQTTPSDDDWKAKFERLIAALGEEAERREWCPQFDQFMEDNGFEGLCGTLRIFTVHRTATVEWDTTVEARSQEHAERLARELDDPGYIYSIEEQDRYGDVSNVEVESVEEA